MDKLCLGLSERPDAFELDKLAMEYDTIVTLQEASEGAKRFGFLVRKAGMDWLWFPAPDTPAFAQRWDTSNYHAVAHRLKQGKCVLIHCAAGIYRTGAFAYRTLLTLGLSSDEAINLIKKIRPMAMEGVRLVKPDAI